MDEEMKVLLITSPGDRVEYKGFDKEYTYTALCDNPDILDEYGMVVCAPFRREGWTTNESNKCALEKGGAVEKSVNRGRKKRRREDRAKKPSAQEMTNCIELRQYVSVLLWEYILTGGKAFFMLPGSQRLQIVTDLQKGRKREKKDDRKDMDYLPGMLAWSSMSSLILAALFGPDECDPSWRIEPVGAKRWGRKVKVAVSNLKGPFEGLVLGGRGKPIAVPFRFVGVDERKVTPLAWWGDEKFPLLAGSERREGIALLTVCPLVQVDAKVAVEIFAIAEDFFRTKEIKVWANKDSVFYRGANDQVVSIGRKRGGSLYHTLLLLAEEVRDGHRQVPLEVIEKHLKRQKAITMSGVGESVRGLWNKYLKRLWPRWPRGKPGLSLGQGFVHIDPRVASLLLRTLLPDDYGEPDGKYTQV